jgi:uncharacterized protein YggE
MTDRHSRRSLARLSAVPAAPALCLLAGCAGPTYLATPSVPAEHTITVGGSASIDVVPDEACVELTLAARDASMPAVHAALVASDDGLLGDLRGRPGLVVEQGATSYAPEYESDSTGRTHLARYAASTQVNVRMRDFAQIADVIGRAAARGLDRVSVVYYSTQIVAKKEDVRAQAVKAAHEKASAMTHALGVALGDVVTIVEGDSHSSTSTGSGNYLERVSVDKAPDVPAPPGAIPLSTSVTVVFRLD